MHMLKTGQAPQPKKKKAAVEDEDSSDDSDTEGDADDTSATDTETDEEDWASSFVISHFSFPFFLLANMPFSLVLTRFYILHWSISSYIPVETFPSLLFIARASDRGVYIYL